MADLLDRTATQVRLYGREVHKRKTSTFVPGHGHHYHTGCGHTLAAEYGAMLTTRPVTCVDCQSGTNATDRQLTSRGRAVKDGVR